LFASLKERNFLNAPYPSPNQFSIFATEVPKAFCETFRNFNEIKKSHAATFASGCSFSQQMTFCRAKKKPRPESWDGVERVF
jgi:hypothetical protein